jgi:hypothetical protein
LGRRLHIKRGLGCEYINAQNIFERTKSMVTAYFFFIILDTPPVPTKVETVTLPPQGRYTDGVQRSFRIETTRTWPDLTEEQKASGRLYSLLYSYTNVCWFNGMLYIGQTRPMFQSHEPVHLILAAASNDKQLRAGKNVVCIVFCAYATLFIFCAAQNKKYVCFLTLTKFPSH